MNKPILSLSFTFTPLFLFKTHWLGFVFLLVTGSTAIAESKSALQQAPEIKITQGEKAFQQGDFENAVLHWSNASQIFAERNDIVRQTTALTKLADAYQALGQYPASIDVLINANSLLTQTAY